MAIATVLSLPDGQQECRPGPSAYDPNDTSFEVCTIAFDDDGLVVNPEDASSTAECIRSVRRRDLAGAIVMCFVHGWHHGSEWDDDHFVAFRETLASLSLREAERYSEGGPRGRRVIGVYLSWNGDPKKKPLFRHLSFWDRYGVAEAVGGSTQLLDVLTQLVTATKDPDVAPGRPESPFVLVGHSMGALIVESAFLALLRDPKRPLIFRATEGHRGVEIREGTRRISFPDVVIALNSAADSAVFASIRDTLRTLNISKSLDTGAISYAAPLIISFTSTADKDTAVIWRLAKPGRCTDGHDEELHSHVFRATDHNVECHPRPGPDFGQNWHCLRPPVPAIAPNPTFTIDLPSRERTGVADRPPHDRYILEPKAPSEQSPAWVFHVGEGIIPDHNDIFNSRCASLVLALTQVSGAVASLAQDLQDSFEAC
jgi:pimeloyl-ACP methyl ester carboxylesterase